MELGTAYVVILLTAKQTDNTRGDDYVSLRARNNLWTFQFRKFV